MASIFNTKIRHANATRQITYITNDPEITTVYSSWSGTEETTYRFYYYDVVSSSTNFLLLVYVNDVYEGTITATYQSGTAFTWNGVAYYDSITLNISCGAGSIQLLDEKFTLKKEDTLGLNDMMFGTNKVYKINFIDGTGTHLVYHEQIVTPTYYTRSLGTYNITWYYTNSDPDINVDMWARIGTASFTEMDSDIAPGAYGTLAFTGLSASTAYNIDIYCKPSTALLKIDSAQATNTQTTNAPPVKTWVYQGTTGTYSISWGTGGVSPPTCAKWHTSVSYSWLESNHAASGYAVGYKARVYVDDTAVPFPNRCYHYYEIEMV